MLSVKCPQCGGTVTFDENHIATYCTFCGTHLPDMTNYVKNSVDFEIEKKRHNLQMETMDKEIRKEQTAGKINKANNILNIIGFAVKAIPVIMFFYLMIKLITYAFGK